MSYVKKTTTKLATFRPKTYSYKQKNKRNKIVFHKIKLKFEDYKHCLKVTQLENKINKLESK